MPHKMEFPQDIWREIMNYFPTVYHEPPHYNAIMGIDMFRKRKRINEDPYTTLDDKSFYISIVISSWWYWAFPDIQRLMVAPEVPLTRGVASGYIRQEFIEIYDKYLLQGHNMEHNHYDI